MQISMIGGIVFAFACIIISILLGGKVSDFIDVQSIFIVLGGVIGATVATYPLSDLKRIPKLIKLALGKSKIDVYKDIDKIIELAELARKEGLLALENATEGLDDPFMKNGVMLILDGSDPELVKNVMETEVYFMADRHASGAGMFNKMSALSPAFGMVGTLIGLINMLVSLSDSDNLGPAMAVALVTTFYGVIFANVIFGPIASQLAIKSEEEQLRKNIIIEGILSIQDGENPRVIRDKLTAFVSRESLAAPKKGKGAAAAPAKSDEGADE